LSIVVAGGGIYLIQLLGGALWHRRHQEAVSTNQEQETSVLPQDGETVSETKPVRETIGMDLEDSPTKLRNARIKNHDTGIRGRRSPLDAEDLDIDRESEDEDTD
jgi:hypothetical protein